MIKKLSLLITLTYIIISFWTVEARDYSQLDKKLNVIFEKISEKWKVKQIKIFNTFINKIDIFIEENPEKTELAMYLKSNFEQQLKLLNTVAQIDMKSKETLILRFWNTGDHIAMIHDNIEKIKSAKSIFLFRKSVNLSSENLKEITSTIKSIQPNIIFFIDQEWWIINRFTPYQSYFNIEDYMKVWFVYSRYIELNQWDKNILLWLFKDKKYFPSMEDIWKKYKKISKNNQKIYLELIAYFQLKMLSDHGINTHGLIADLDRWNPAISWLWRSFSSNIYEYKLMIDAYILAAKEINIMLYLKHFPWHGAGNIDSHTGILNYKWEEKYIKENLEIFDYFFKNKNWMNLWVMVGHMFIPESLKDNFNSILDKSDFILTDDLAMWWYKLAKTIPDSLFFSTVEIEKRNNLIIVNTKNQIGIK